MSKQIDARGERCPIPVILAKKAMAAGEAVFTVTVDDPTAVENLTRLANNQGFSITVRALDGGAHALDFVRQGDPAPTACEIEADGPLPGPGCAILVTRDVLGEGERELGTNLIRMFFYTLTESEVPPSAVVFINSGVKLPTLDDQVAGHVQALLGKGVEVQVCGTCLSYYGLTDRLRAGTVSNMFDIVSRLQDSAKVITL